MKRASTDLLALIGRARLSIDDVGTALDYSPSSIRNKLAGRRPWRQSDIEKLLALISTHLGRRVVYEDAFPRARR